MTDACKTCGASLYGHSSAWLLTILDPCTRTKNLVSLCEQCYEICVIIGLSTHAWETPARTNSFAFTGSLQKFLEIVRSDRRFESCVPEMLFYASDQEYGL